jgi:RNA polymerase sigma-70 factor, ECF subfamily
MAERPEAEELAAALGGDADAFCRLTDSYTRELHVHCYRMLGSIQDAEDAVQETMMRAWRHLATFAGRSTFRAWLYRIATNVCLSRRPRAPVDRSLPLPIARAIAVASEPSINLSPYPDALLDQLEATWGNPETEYDLRESVQLAFLAALQLLPARHRAVLILRDVLGWSAAEAAEMLDTTSASVNNALQRARATLEQQRAAGRLRSSCVVASDAVDQSLAERYVEAFQARDLRRFTQILALDVVLTMPPLPLRYVGREAVAAFYEAVPYVAPGQFTFFRTRANREPALAAYRRDTDADAFRPVGMWVLRADGRAIAEITAFIDASLPAFFGLPNEIHATA